MGQLVIYALLGIFAVVHCEIHTLQYIYTSLSKPINVPDVYKFTAMGILDDRGIDYYNSQDKVKKPTQGWMAENLKQDYWDKGTQSRKSKEEWFNVNVKILMDRMRQNDSDVHILQWMHGCTIEKTPDGETKFVKGFDQYGYDGNDFLSFNDADMQWVAPVTEARPTKTKWDSVDILNQYTKGYLERECVEWLNNFLTYSEAQLRQASPPEVTIFARKSPQPDSRNLVCFATGFYPKDIEMDILQNDIPLTESNGVTSSGVRPNGDGTHQLMKTLTIGASDKARYSCLVKHRALTEPVKKDWDGTCCNCATTLGIGVAVGIPIGVLLAAAVAGCLAYFFRRKFRAVRGGCCGEIKKLNIWGKRQMRPRPRNLETQDMEAIHLGPPMKILKAKEMDSILLCCRMDKLTMERLQMACQWRRCNGAGHAAMDHYGRMIQKKELQHIHQQSSDVTFLSSVTHHILLFERFLGVGEFHAPSPPRLR